MAKIRYIIGSITGFLLLFLCGIPSISAQQESELIIAVDAWPPFMIQDDDTYTGIDIDVWHQLSEKLGFSIGYLQCSWLRCLKLMKQGKVDGTSSLAFTEERMLFIDYIKPAYFECSTVLYVNSSTNNKIREYEDMYQHKIGVVPGSTYFPRFDQDTKLDKFGVDNEKQLIKMLALQRLSVIIGTDCQVDYDIARLGLNDSISKTDYRPGNTVSLHLGLSKKSPYSARLSEFSAALNQLIADKTIEKIGKNIFNQFPLESSKGNSQIPPL